VECAEPSAAVFCLSCVVAEERSSKEVAHEEVEGYRVQECSFTTLLAEHHDTLPAPDVVGSGEQRQILFSLSRSVVTVRHVIVTYGGNQNHGPYAHATFRCVARSRSDVPYWPGEPRPGILDSQEANS
jgi:hypothetical protein